MLASELRHKATVNWERIRKQREAAREREIKQGYDCLLKRMNELAENGHFSHVFRGDREECTAYMCSLERLGFRVDLDTCEKPVYSLYIDWN